MKLRICVYDNGGATADRYTITFHGKYRHMTGGAYLYLGCSGAPFHPQGIGMTTDSPTPVDIPAYGHLGKKLKGSALLAIPDDVKTFIRQTARHLLLPEHAVTTVELDALLHFGAGNFPKQRKPRSVAAMTSRGAASHAVPF